MIAAIHQPQYLPWVPYCDKADACDVFVYLDTVQFHKNGIQNRNQIKTSNGASWLTIPVSVSLGDPIARTRIADQKWQKRHTAGIAQSYARAPFVGLYAEGLRPILEREWSLLADVDVAVTEWMFERLGIGSRRVRASELGPLAGSATELVINVCKAVGADVYLSGQGARAYQDPAHFAANGIELRYQEYQNQPYPQCHPALGFVPDLSALDLILNAGPGARDIMLAGRRAPSERDREVGA
jgi:hypothetical protein